MDGLDLRHDVLDAQLVDRHGEKIGRCDGLMLELRDGRPPRVATLVIGGEARAERIGRWMVGLARLMRRREREHADGASRIPFSAVRVIGNTMQLDVERTNLPSERVERWLSTHVVGRIPGAERKRESGM